MFERMMDAEHRISSGFRRLLDTLDFASMENNRGTVFGLWADLRLAYLNPWWFRFAGENKGEPRISLEWGLGRPVMDSVPDVLKSYYGRLYESVFRRAPSTAPVRHEYECSGPSLFRRYLMTLYCLGSSEGILVVNSAVVEAPLKADGREDFDALLDVYAGENGLIRQCANCRKTQNAKEPNRWDWVPAYVVRPPPWISHTLCDLCLLHYYGRE